MKRVRFVSVLFVLVAMAVGLPVAGWCGDKISKPFQYSGYTFPEYAGYERFAQYVPVSDGTNLAVVWYVPSGGPSQGPFPVIFTYDPYHYEITNPVTGVTKPHYNQEAVDLYTSYGYVMVMADMRGSGGSYGTRINTSEPLAEDGKDLVDWIAGQTWCDGNVGMMGVSYLGWSQYATAGRQPAALKCIIPGLIGFDKYTAPASYPGGIRVRGGVLGANEGPTFYDKNVYWPGVSFEALATPASPMIDEDGDGEIFDEIPLDLNGDGSFIEDYQLPDNPPQYEDGNPRQHIYYLMTLEHMGNPHTKDETVAFRDSLVLDGYDITFADMTPNDYPIRIAETEIPVCHIGGWFDRFVNGTTMWYATLAKTNPSRMMIGPNVHHMPGALATDPGPYWEYFGENLEDVDRGYNIERLRYFDHYLKGIDNDIDAEDPVYIYVMNGGGWRAEKHWPLKRQKVTDYYFGEGNTLKTKASKEGADDYTADFTHDSRQETSNANRWNGGTLQGPLMRTEKDLKCLTYTTDSLEKDAEVTGHPIVHLWVSSTASDGDFYAYLEDVDENGNAFHVSDGVLRAGFAKLVDNDVMLPPGSKMDVLPDLPWHGFNQADFVEGILANNAVVELVFDMWPTSWVFKTGHKIRVSIACADYPTFTLNPVLCPTNNPADPNTIVPTVTVHRNKAYASRIELPIIPSSK